MAKVPAKLAHDPRVTLASPEAQLVYLQLCGQRRIEVPTGASLLDLVVSTCAMLGADPRARAERALHELRDRKLLVEQDDGTFVPAHAPRARVARFSPGAGDAGSDAVVIAGVELPGARQVDSHIRKAFSKTMSEDHRHDPRRLDETPAGKEAWKTFVLDLWVQHQRTYKPRRRSTDAAEGSPTPPAVTPVTEDVSLVSTPPAPSGYQEGENAATADPERGRGEKDRSLSLFSGGSGEETFQTPRTRDPESLAVVTGAVTVTTITSPVTSPEVALASPPTPPQGPPLLTPRALKAALKATEGKVGYAGAANRAEVLKILHEEGFTRAELLAFARLAKRGLLFTQDTHPRVGLDYLLQEIKGRPAAILHRWIDDVRAELLKQPELGLAANDARTGAAASVAPATPRSTGPPRDARSEVAAPVVPDVVMSPVIAARAERLAQAKAKTGT